MVRWYSRAMRWLALALVVLGCGSSTGPSAGEPVPVAEDTEFTLDRTECFGTCPSYSVRITSSGAVAYHGRRFVRVIGDAAGQVTSDVLQRLLGDFFGARYWDLSVPADCPNIYTDESSASTSLTWNGRTHSVDHYHGNVCAPPVLFDLEREIDDVATTGQWVSCAPDPSCQ
jgi:hypothetical protein